MTILSRLSNYLRPEVLAIILAGLCSLMVALSEMGYVHVLADTIDALKVIERQKTEANGSDTPTKITYFKFNKVFDGFQLSIDGTNGAFQLIGGALGILLALVLIKGIFNYFNNFLSTYIGLQLNRKLRDEIYQRIIFMPIGVLQRNHTGDIMARMTDDVRVLQHTSSQMAGVLQATVYVPVFIVVMLFRSFSLTISSLLVLPLMGHLANQFGKRIRNVSREMQKKTSDLSSQLKETIFGIKIIKSFTAEELELQRFRETIDLHYSIGLKRARITSMLSPLMELLSAIGIGSVFGFGCWQVMNGKLSTGWFVGSLTMIGLMFKPIKTIGTFNGILQRALASAERIFQVLELENESIEKISSTSHLSPVRGAIEFRNVSFAYDSDRVILDKIDIRANPDEVVALVGPSGSGKSTLLNLLPRFYEVSSGEIRIDGTNISELGLSALRSQIAIVPQETVLFDGTVMENISYGNRSAPLEAVTEAAKQANAHDFISELPKGYDTPIGELGVRLSGGQKQRLSIARAIIKDPRILLLDEATSALDSESEALVQESLQRLMKNRTTFVIAHRLSTVQHAHKIVVLSDGKIIETGSHSELMAKDSKYRKFATMQFYH